MSLVFYSHSATLSLQDYSRNTEPPQKLGLIQDKAAHSIAGQRIINLKGQITCVLHTLHELPKARWPEDTDAHLSSRKVNQGHTL